MTVNRSDRTIALIGGKMTVEDGALMDSRQPIDGDGTSEVMRQTLASSSRWWAAVSTLTMPILEEVGAEAFALVIGERSVIDIRADGSIKRTSLRGILPGGTDTIRIVRTRINDDTLPAGLIEATTLRTGKGASLGKIGVELSRGSGGRWRFLDGNDFYMKHAGPVIAPAVIVDTTYLVAGPTDYDVDGRWKVGEPLKHQTALRFTSLEERRLFDDTMVIVPHTFRNEAMLRSYTEWIAAGRPPATEVGPWTSPNWDPLAPPNPIRYARLLPVEADFRITGLVERGRWVPPVDLDAARSLLATRFDLKIGIWDLANNSILQETLLERKPISSTPTECVNLPSMATRRADAVVARKVTGREEEAQAIGSLLGSTNQLASSGWLELGQGRLRFGLTEPVRRWPDETQPRPLVYLILTVLKRQLTVAAMTSMNIDIKMYVRDRRDQLVAIAGSASVDVKSVAPILLRLRGGWADDVDWRLTSADVSAKTSLWVPLFADLVAECRQIIAARERRVADE